MAIIRNDRSRNDRSRRAESDSTYASEVEPEEIEIDYTWHPNEDEYVSPLTAGQWAELFDDEEFMQSDAGRAVRCLREYGEPATFQQLSIRYRGTMGRYRRWLADAARTAGERFDVPAPQQDQFGMDEWWPLLYQTRNAGKPGAGIFEMALRPEVEEAFLQLEEKERLAKRAENARQLHRIEQLERARQEERRRAAAPQEEAPQAQPKPAPKEPIAMANPTIGPAPEAHQAQAEAASQRIANDGVVSVPMSHFRTTEDTGASPNTHVDAMEHPLPVLPAMRAFLQLMEEQSSPSGTRFVAGSTSNMASVADAAVPVDYALRYAERLRYAFALMRGSMPSLSLAAMARVLGDTSVEQLQSIVNGQVIPEFSYLDTLHERLFIGIERLEAPDGSESALPAFATLGEALGVDQVGPALMDETPLEVAYIVDDSDDRRTGVIVQFSDARCALLTRSAVRGAARRADNAELEAFIRMVDELDGFTRAQDVRRTSRQISAKDWDSLAAGNVWPGSLLG